MKIDSIRHCILFVSLMACSSKEVRTEYYEDDKTVVQVKREFLDKQQHGIETVFDKKGKVVQTSEWKNGKLNGKVVDYYPNGSIASVVNFYNGKLVGKAEKYLESGLLEQSNYYDSTGNLYNTVMYKPDGAPKEMDIVFYVKKGEIGDSVDVRVSLINVVDRSYLIGSLFVGKKFIGETLSDTLLSVLSKKNNYQFRVKAEKGQNKLCFQLLFPPNSGIKDTVNFISFERVFPYPLVKQQP
jgi:hypothetical protein